MKVLFVCTGNICRSPMAEGIARHLAGASGRSDLHFSSAGVGAIDGLEASENAIRVAKRNGIDLKAHRSRRVTEEVLNDADLIVPMEAAHKASIILMQPGLENRVKLLYEFGGSEDVTTKDVKDPIGGDESTYWDTFFEIRGLVEDLVANTSGGQPA